MKVLESPIARFIIDNLGWILISLSLASIIWVVASLEDNPIEEQDFPSAIAIEFIENPSDGDMLLNSATLRRSARVTIRAPRQSLNEITEDHIRIYADLDNLEPGTHNVELHAELTDDSPSGRVISISPSDIAIEIVAISQTTIPIRIDTPGELSPQLQLIEEPQCEQNTVQVSGPESIINRLTRGVVQINLQSLSVGTETLSYSIEPRTTNDGGLSARELENITIEPRFLNCTTILGEIEGGQNILVNPVFEGQLPDGYIRGDFSINPPNVFVTGDAGLITALNNSVDTLPINLDGQTNDFSREVTLALPEGLSAQPATVTITISVTPRIATRQFADISVQALNVAPTLNVNSIVPQTISITVEGPEPLINSLSIEDLRATVDLEGRNVGTYADLPIVIEVLQDIELSQIEVSPQPQNVSVVIAAPATPTPLPIRVWGR